MENLLSWNDFEKVEMRIGTVLTVNDFPQAKIPSYQLTIDFGPTVGVLKSAAQITKNYTKENLIGKQLVAVVNFPKKQIANFNSECLILGAVGENNNVVLLNCDVEVPNGLQIG